MDNKWDRSLKDPFYCAAITAPPAGKYRPLRNI